MTVVEIPLSAGVWPLVVADTMTAISPGSVYITVKAISDEGLILTSASNASVCENFFDPTLSPSGILSASPADVIVNDSAGLTTFTSRIWIAKSNHNKGNRKYSVYTLTGSTGHIMPIPHVAWSKNVAKKERADFQLLCLVFVLASFGINFSFMTQDKVLGESLLAIRHASPQ